MKKTITTILLTPMFLLGHSVFADTQTEINQIETELKTTKEEESKIELKDTKELEENKNQIETKLNDLKDEVKEKTKKHLDNKKEKSKLQRKLEKRKEELKSSFGFAKLNDNRPFLDKVVDLVTFQDTVSEEIEEELSEKEKEQHNSYSNVVSTLTKLSSQRKELETKTKELEDTKKNEQTKEDLTKKSQELEENLNKKKNQLEEEKKAEQSKKEQPQQTTSRNEIPYTPGGSVRLSNGNTAGSIGVEAAKEMERRTGVPASTWELIIARESNGDPNAYNPSGASGLFQTMPGWGSTATVEDQINAAEKAYRLQGLPAWGM